MHLIPSLRAVTLGLALAASLTACDPVPPNSAFLNRGGPESLLDVSSEVVNLNAASASDMVELSNWIDHDQPTRAQLNCDGTDKRCGEARKILELHGVPVVPGTGTSNDQSVSLMYERILARDCNQRYVDRVTNDHNVASPSFGCSVAANMVQQVTDKQEFISPNVSDDPSAKRAVNDYHRAFAPRLVVDPYSVGESQTAKSASGN